MSPPFDILLLTKQKWVRFMKDISNAKSLRLLDLYARFANGEIMKKATLAAQYQVSERSIQRDISMLRDFIAERELPQELIYDPKQSGYRLSMRLKQGLTDGEMLAVCKILLDSRSLRKDEMISLLERLINCCMPEHHRKAIKDMLLNEEYHYIEPHHRKHLIDTLWFLGQAIQSHKLISIQYRKLNADCVCREIEPVGLMFSEFYFYLVGFIQNIDKEQSFQNPADTFPTIYRVDRISKLHVLDKHFTLPYNNRFEEGEFRKRIQFMYGGKLQTVHFHYVGPSIEAVLDRLPTAKIKSSSDRGWDVSAEVFGTGIEMWLKSQGNYIAGGWQYE